MNKYDVIIVGAGPSGYMCAYELNKKNPNLKVLLIDKGKDINTRYCPVLNHLIERCPSNKEGVIGCHPSCSMQVLIVIVSITLQQNLVVG